MPLGGPGTAGPAAAARRPRGRRSGEGGVRGDLSDANGCLCRSARGTAAERREEDDEDRPASPYAEGNLAMSVTQLRCPSGWPR